MIQECEYSRNIAALINNWTFTSVRIYIYHHAFQLFAQASQMQQKQHISHIFPEYSSRFYQHPTGAVTNCDNTQTHFMEKHGTAC